MIHLSPAEQHYYFFTGTRRHGWRPNGSNVQPIEKIVTIPNYLVWKLVQNTEFNSFKIVKTFIFIKWINFPIIKSQVSSVWTILHDNSSCKPKCITWIYQGEFSKDNTVLSFEFSHWVQLTTFYNVAIFNRPDVRFVGRSIRYDVAVITLMPFIMRYHNPFLPHFFHDTAVSMTLFVRPGETLAIIAQQLGSCVQ